MQVIRVGYAARAAKGKAEAQACMGGNAPGAVLQCTLRPALQCTAAGPLTCVHPVLIWGTDYPVTPDHARPHRHDGVSEAVLSAQLHTQCAQALPPPLPRRVVGLQPDRVQFCQCRWIPYVSVEMHLLGRGSTKW